MPNLIGPDPVSLFLAPQVDTGDEVSERLFGLSKRVARDRMGMGDALFAGRGLPEDVSGIVQREVAQGLKYPEEIGGYTPASVAEIERVGFVMDGNSSSDWLVVFKLIEGLLTDERFTKDNLRFIVWSNW